MEIDFPGKHMGMTRLLNRPTVAGPVAWMGSLVQDAQDASGLMYRRNRYYDPISSRFTQEDPIGLDGGVNSYGFADGDPVSYDDPYGLITEGRTKESHGDTTKTGCDRCPIGSEAGAEATEYWADRAENGETALERGTATVIGHFATLWTPETATKTGLTLATAGVASLAIRRSRAAGITVRALRYQNTGGGGITWYKNGQRVFGLDWHRFTTKSGQVMNRVHYHRRFPGLGGGIGRHRPWDGW